MAALAELLGEALAAPDGSAVATASLPARGVSLVGLFFGYCGGGPCAQVAANLAAFYARFQPGGPEGAAAAAATGGASAAAAPSRPPPQRLEIVFVSAEQEQPRWQEATRAMPWPALPFADKRRKLKLWNKFRVSNIPSLIFIDANTGKVICRNGLLVIRDDPEGLEFPWGPRPFGEVVAGPLLRNSGPPLESSVLEGSHVGVYFSAHWCPPCRSLTRVLVESYRKIKETGQKFEIVFVSADRSEESFKQYFSEMPWLSIPYADEGRRSRLNRLYGIQGIPTLIVLDTKGDMITRQGRVEVLNDIECKEFPWHPKPVLELTDSNAVQLNEGPCLVLFVDSDDDGESEAAKQLIQPIAEKIIAQYKAKDEEIPLLFFVAGEDDMTDSLRDYTNLPEAAPLLTILDMSARAKYVMDVEEITPPIVETFVNDFLADKLKPEPI
ncbi:nucleoredoxin [Crotalus tigris]|uniref:nucleoredoxin n=1 Tax=Crotalus tigris TaxID=88082 RepID=UPI00192FB061|nr:nucleoredoxin [Crotalus tigris]